MQPAIPGVAHPESPQRIRVPITGEKVEMFLDLLNRTLGERWFLVGGSLLGSVREGATIAWDHDVDAGVLVEDWDTEFLRRFVPSGFMVARVRRWAARGLFAWTLDHLISKRWTDGVSVVRIELPKEPYRHHIDLHVYYPGIGVCGARRFSQRGPTGKVIYHPRVLLEGTQEAGFHGRTIRVPRRAEDYLAHVYGPDWRSPSYWAKTEERQRIESYRILDRGWQPIVFSGGKFDLLHHGHEALLGRARALGGRLVVGVLSDERIRAQGGEPQIPEARRAEQVRELGIADEVIVYGSALEVLEDVHPAAIVHGEDWQRIQDGVDVAEAAALEGTEVVLLPRTPGISSSGLRATV